MSIHDPSHIQARGLESTLGTRKPKTLRLARLLTYTLWYDPPFCQIEDTQPTAFQGAYKFLMQVRVSGVFMAPLGANKRLWSLYKEYPPPISKLFFE